MLAQPPTYELNLLNIDQIDDHDWFSTFEQLEDNLTKCLLLVAVLTSQGLVSAKEASSFKKFLMAGVDMRNNQALATFTRSKSLYTLRSVFRGYLGLPRMRKSDSLSSSNRKQPASLSPKKSAAIELKLSSLQQFSLTPLKPSWSPDQNVHSFEAVHLRPSTAGGKTSHKRARTGKLQ